MSDDKPKTEVELSPYVIKYWENKGYCVHGEVALFYKSTFIDHVAHTGPCHSPEKVVNIEMKKGAGKSLRRQLYKLDKQHTSEELWGVVISTPRESTLEKFNNISWWIQPGLLLWEPEGLKVLQESKIKRNYKRASRKKRLLLIEENQNILAGYSSRHEDNNYCTHFSVIKDHLETKILTSDELVSSDELWDTLPPAIDVYRKKRSAMNRALRVLEDEDKKIQVIERKGKVRFFGANEKDALGWDVDPRFEEFFEGDED